MIDRKRRASLLLRHQHNNYACKPSFPRRVNDFIEAGLPPFRSMNKPFPTQYNSQGPSLLDLHLQELAAIGNLFNTVYDAMARQLAYAICMQGYC
jgi:hypothetical protein